MLNPKIVSKFVAMIKATLASGATGDSLALKAAAKLLVDEKPARHLVIYRGPITCSCANCEKREGAAFFHVKTFSSLVSAETYRTSLYCRTGNETRLISSARVCERYQQLAAAWNPADPEPMVNFLADQFLRATSPACN